MSLGGAFEYSTIACGEFACPFYLGGLDLEQTDSVFPNATSIIALIDRLCHNAAIVSIDADSSRNKETQERIAARTTARRRPRKP